MKLLSEGYNRPMREFTPFGRDSEPNPLMVGKNNPANLSGISRQSVIDQATRKYDPKSLQTCRTQMPKLRSVFRPEARKSRPWGLFPPASPLDRIALS